MRPPAVVAPDECETGRIVRPIVSRYHGNEVENILVDCILNDEVSDLKIQSL